MRNTENAAQKEEENNPDVVDAFGSLSLSLSGGAKYYGQIANSWVGQANRLLTKIRLTCPSQYFLQVWNLDL